MNAYKRAIVRRLRQQDYTLEEAVDRANEIIATKRGY